MKQQLITMLEMQDAMNAKVNQDWRERNHEWYRAIWIEAAELMDHYGWKWWKKQTPDRDQVVLELVDIWHFGLSDLIMKEASVDACADKVIAELDMQAHSEGFREAVEAFASKTLSTQSFDIQGFAQLMVGMDLSFEDLYGRYVGKNVLNFFRQDHGYKEGSYIKVWDGREDNEHLVELIDQLDQKSSDFKDKLYGALAERYPK